MNKHTAQTLKWYLGGDVFDVRDAHVGELVSLGSVFLGTYCGDYCGIKIDDKNTDGTDCFIQVPYQFAYPILKTVEDLTDDDSIEIFLAKPKEIFLNFRHVFINRVSDIDPEALSRLIEKGYGAIPDKGSPTGYVDLFGMPCYTPKMVDGL